MTRRLLALFTILAAIHAALPTASARTVCAADSAILWTGRTAVSPEGQVRFNYPGVSARVRFSGPSLTMETSPESGYWVIEVDTLPMRKVYAGPGVTSIAVAENMADTIHEARVIYAVEGYEYKPVVKSFEANEFLAPPARPTLRIEFIGNSITCGYGTEAEGGDTHFSYETENHTLAYPFLAAEALKAEAHIVARSGMGVYRCYNGPRSGSKTELLPIEYERTMVYDSITPWDFKSWQPDIVCINVGTNDLSCSNYDLELFEKAMTDFTEQVRRLNPGAKLILLTGPMLGGQALEDARAVLDRVAGHHADVYRFDLTPQDGSLGYGADYHPSAAQSAQAARELTRFIGYHIMPLLPITPPVCE